MFGFWWQWQFQWNLSRLKDPRYSFLFETAPEDEVVCFDCETSSLNPKKAQLLSIGAVKIAHNKILTSQKLELFIKPTAEIDHASIKVHRLRHVDVENGLDVKEAIEKFLEFIGPRKLVGYYLEFDVAMINKYMKPLLGVTLPNQQVDISGLFYNSKLRSYPVGMPHPHIDLRFDTMLEELGLPVLGKHDAFNDALMTAMIYVKLLNSFSIK
jgi:DNA polymerase III subunit epsilon